MNTYEAHAIAIALEERVDDLRKYRDWYVRHTWARGPNWDDLRAEDRIELRSLIRILRRARRAIAAEQLDPITAAKAAYPAGASYHDVQSERFA